MNRNRYTPVPDAGIEALLNRTLKEIAAEIESLHLPHLCAVILGGGYGRGEGGIRHTPSGGRLYNDLDFFVFTDGADFLAAARINRKLKKISLRWEKELGIAVDFSQVKDLSTLKKDGHTLMFQELLRGWKPVWGQVELKHWIPLREAAELPYSEAIRLLLNRGMGLVLAGNLLKIENDDPDFIVRNLNKAILGGGDAVLIAAGDYRWRGHDRVTAYADYVRMKKLPPEYAAFYEKAFRWKLEPDPVLSPDPKEDWRKCRDFFLASVCTCAGVAAGSPVPEVTAGIRRRAGKERSIKNGLRWLVRTRTLRPPSETFDPPAVSMLNMLYAKLAEKEIYPDLPQRLKQWRQIFH